MLLAAPVWPFVQETGRLLERDEGDKEEGQVRPTLNEAGGGRWVVCRVWVDILLCASGCRLCPELEDPTWTLISSRAYNRL